MNKLMNVCLVLMFCVVLACVGFFVYRGTFQASFQYDDFTNIVNNNYIKDVSQIKAIWDILPHPSRFIGFLSFAVNYHYHQLNVTSYHVTNYIIHLLNTLLVWWLVWQILSLPLLENDFIKQNSPLISYFAALLFLVHPGQTQSVSYISGRVTSLAAFFYLLTICGYIHSRVYTRGPLAVLFYILTFISAIFGMLTNQIIVTLPIMFLFVEGLLLKKYARDFKNPILFIFLLCAITTAIFILIISNFNIAQVLFTPKLSTAHEGDIITFGKYFLTQFRVLTRFTRLFVYPVNQNFDYDFALSQNIFEGGTFFSIIWIGFLVYLSIFLRRKKTILSFGLLWFFIVLSVNIVPQPHIICEQYFYLASVGLCLFFVTLIFSLLRDRAKSGMILVLIVYIMALMTLQRNLVWKSEMSLWSDVIKKSPNKFEPNLNLARALVRDEDYDQALEYLHHAIGVRPGSSQAYTFRGNIYQQLKQYDLALNDFQQAVKLDPRSVLAYYNRGRAFIQKDKLDLALHDFNTALTLDPGLVQAYLKRGDVYNQLGNHDLAIKDYNHYQSIEPENPKLYFQRGNVYMDKKEYDLALKDYLQAISYQPDYGEAYANMGLVYQIKGEYDSAIAYFDKALEANPFNAKIHIHRGDIYQDQNRMTMALNEYSEAIRLDREFIDAYISRAMLYKAQGDLQKALQDINNAIKIKPLADLFNYRGLIFKALGQYPAALHDYQKAIELNPRYINAYGNKGIIHFERREFDLAIADFNTVIALQPDLAMAYFMRSLIYHQKGQPDQALSDALKAKELGHRIKRNYILMLQNNSIDKASNSLNNLTTDIILPRDQLEELNN